MAEGIALLIVLGLLFEWLARKLKMPGLIGLLLLGVLLGPYALKAVNAETATVAEDLRLIALVVILLRAGFEISKEALTRVGLRAILLAFIPCLFEISAVVLVAPYLLNLTLLESAMLGAILAAVSPAVVVPLMIEYIKRGLGAKRSVPTMVLAAASCDDAVAIVLSGAFIGLYTGHTTGLTARLLGIPISLLTGILLGLVLGFAFYWLFKRFNPRASKRVIMLLGLSVLLLNFEDVVHPFMPFAALLSIMATGFIILEKDEHMAHELSSKLGKIWVFAQLLLFVLIGMKVNVPVAVNAGLAGAGVILTGLIGRSIGVQFCLAGSALPARERMFVGIAYLPKATVQAAIGATPLVAMQAAGLSTAPGELILAIAVLSILLTAPTGALAISWAAPRLLRHDGHRGDQTPARAAALESESCPE